MHTEVTELTTSHVGLGTLTEPALIDLFSNACAHAVTKGGASSMREVRNAKGEPLSANYYWTHLRVPRSRLLSRYGAWDRVAVGAEVRSWGGTMLASEYALCPSVEALQESVNASTGRYPTFEAASLLCVDGQEPPRPSVPRREDVALLPQMKQPPAAAKRFNEIRAGARIKDGLSGLTTGERPLRYPLRTGRDLSPGHGISCSDFIGLCDGFERAFFAERLQPGAATALLDALQVVERETAYVGNLRTEEVVLAHVRCAAFPEQEGGGGEESEEAFADVAIVPCRLEIAIDVYAERTNQLLLATHATKIFALPMGQASLAHDAARFLRFFETSGALPARGG
jgi:probable biosynthetic protein (TIGR04098 family)